MHKKLLLATVLVSSIHIANATCTPPTTLKCNCAHPIINSEGKLACGSSYCGDKKCMPDGSCCETEKYCEVGDAKYCCAENQTCDTTAGCVNASTDFETICVNGKGTVMTIENGNKFCRSNEAKETLAEAKDWCSSNGMTMLSMYDLCPDWVGCEISGCSCAGFEGDYPKDGNNQIFFWSSTSGYILTGYGTVDTPCYDCSYFSGFAACWE